MIQRTLLPIALAFLLLPIIGRAQSLSLNVSDPEADKVYLQKLDVDVKVTGNIASTTWTMTFRNETSRQLEAELVFPLGDGITVSRYAIDIAGKLREAVPVEKAKGTTVLEAIENRRVDPGLLERVEGNAFRTRIYPLPPRGIRTVVIGYEENLHARTPGQLDYTLPLSFSRAVPKIDIGVSSFAGNSPKAASGDGFDQQGYAWSAKKSLSNYKSGQPLQFHIPQSRTETALMQPTGNRYYTLINTPPRTGSRERTLPDDLSILWDASLSRLARNAKAELDLLDVYLRKVRNARITLVVFSNSLQSKQSFSVRDGNWSALREAIQRVTYDGATQLGKLELGTLPGKEILLFSDGLSTYGPGSLGQSRIPLFAISSNAHSDFGVLRNTALASGGALIDLSSRPLSEAITALTKQELQLLGVKADRDIEDVYPNAPVAAAGGVALTAISYKAKSSVVLQYGYGKEVTQEVRIELDAAAQKAPGADLGRIWAMNKIAALDENYEQNRAEIEQLGRQFRLVTRNTSLIVLENLSDYILYGIEPPEELREAYDRELKARGAQVVSAVRNRVAEAERMLGDLFGWWQQTYSTIAPGPVESRDRFNGKSIPYNSQIAGRVSDTRKNPVSDAVVELRRNGRILNTIATNENGYYAFSGLEEGRYVVSFRYADRERGITRVTLGPNDPKQVHFSIRLNAAEQGAADRLASSRSSRNGGSSGIGTILGTLRDERGNPVVNAYVEISTAGVVYGREVTDFDGYYNVRPLNGGKYTVSFKFGGKELRITDISLAADQTRTVNGTMTTISTARSREVVVRSQRYVAPLIDPKEPGGRSVRTAEQIEKTATRSSLDNAALSTQTYQGGRGEGIAIGGSRASGTKIIIDGVQQNPGAAAFIDQAPKRKARRGTGSTQVSTGSTGIQPTAIQSKGATQQPEASGEVRSVRTASFAFDPEVLAALRQVRPAGQYAKYLELREKSMHIPAFYFGASAHFIAAGQHEIGLRILSNLAELDLENYELYKSLGYKLRELGETAAAAEAFRKVHTWRPMDPQTLRDYGLALADNGRHQAALDTLYAALTMPIDPSLQAGNAGIEEILICDINGLIATQGPKLDLTRIPRSLIQAMPADVRVVLNWNMKNTDIDLWVYDPNDEKTYYGHNRSAIGGRMSRDITQGFGPEQFILRTAIDGKYKVMVNYYGNRQVKISGPTVVSAEIYTHWGTSKEERRMITMQMKPTDNGGVLVGEFRFGKSTAGRAAAADGLQTRDGK